MLDQSTVARVELDWAGPERITMNMGPQHPSAHGVFRAIVTLEGETVVAVDAVIGYLHRCHEKLAETLTYAQYPSLASKTAYVAAMTSEFASSWRRRSRKVRCQRAQYLRVICANGTGRLAPALLALVQDMGGGSRRRDHLFTASASGRTGPDLSTRSLRLRCTLLPGRACATNPLGWGRSARTIDRSAIARRVRHMLEQNPSSCRARRASEWSPELAQYGGSAVPLLRLRHPGTCGTAPSRRTRISIPETGGDRLRLLARYAADGRVPRAAGSHTTGGVFLRHRKPAAGPISSRPALSRSRRSDQRARATRVEGPRAGRLYLRGWQREAVPDEMARRPFPTCRSPHIIPGHMCRVVAIMPVVPCSLGGSLMRRRWSSAGHTPIVPPATETRESLDLFIGASAGRRSRQQALPSVFGAVEGRWPVIPLATSCRPFGC